MTNYSENPGMVRVDFFKPGGKWYMTEAHDMSDVWDFGSYPGAALERVLITSREGRPYWWRQFTVVCLEPYHKSAYPVMILAEP